MKKPFTLKSAREFAGAVSISNSKMPGGSFALATSGCNVGGRLAKVPGSVCHKCYAVRLEQFRPAVKAAWTRNLKRVLDCTENPGYLILWRKAMIVQIRWAVERTNEPYFRWFDSGDIPAGIAGQRMLLAISDIALAMPDVAFWLPTREVAAVRLFLERTGPVPRNLTIRLSAAMVDSDPPSLQRLPQVRTSTVHGKGSAHHGHACPARHQGNQCGTCRACWSPHVLNVSYPVH